jgi:excisionase family DNA binding protein
VARQLTKKWFTVTEVAEMLGYGETKVRMLVICGDLRSLKDGRSRRILPEWVDEYVRRRATEAGHDLYDGSSAA